jgi:hypothetical protein
MSQGENEDLFIDDGGLSLAMRSEAAARAHATNNWTMAALITSNGGASVALLSHADKGLATGIALGLYVLGVTSALVAARLSANVENEAEALFVTLSGSERASRHVFRVARTGNAEMMTRAQAFSKSADEAVDKQRAVYDAAPPPGRPMVLSILCFAVGCVAAGFALF